MGHMNPHLVRAPGLEPAFDEAGQRLAVQIKNLQRLVSAYRRLAARFEDRHFLARSAVAADRRRDAAGGRLRSPLDERQVDPADPMGFELPAQLLVRRIVLGTNHQAACILVQPVHDAGPLDAADARQAALAMMQERVDQGARGVAGPGMYDQPGRFVDDDQIGVLIDHLQGDILGLWFRLGRRRQADFKALAGFDPVCGVGYRGRAAVAVPAVDKPLEQQRLEARAGQIGTFGGQKAIEPLAGAFRGHHDPDPRSRSI